VLPVLNPPTRRFVHLKAHSSCSGEATDEVSGNEPLALYCSGAAAISRQLFYLLAQILDLETGRAVSGVRAQIAPGLAVL